MAVTRPIVVDFETAGIEPRPSYPPIPVGVAIKYPGKKGVYKRIEESWRELRAIWECKHPLLFQNASFDLDVAEVHLGLKRPPWQRIHDTKFLLFLHEPYAHTFSLKPSAERVLGMKPEEQDHVRDWVLANVPGSRKSDWGAYICKAPFELVAPYAVGDVVRTGMLFDKLYTSIKKRGMLGAYDRERELQPILLENERHGVKLDMPALARDMDLYQRALELADGWLRKRLKTKDLNLDADQDVADAFDRCRVVSGWKRTAPTKRHPDGQRSVAKKNLTLNMFLDREVAAVYGYRNRLATCIGTFLSNLYEQGDANHGHFAPTWNQTLGESGGARTGRMSVSLLMNMPKVFGKKKDAEFGPYLELVSKLLPFLPALPALRKYFLPDEVSHLWGRRDYNQQELRILAHFEDGSLMQHYLDDPDYDMHTDVQKGLLDEFGIELDRDVVKTAVNFQDIYGGGAPAMIATMAAYGVVITPMQADRIKKAKRALMPDFAQLEKDVKARGKAGLSIVTWGGREYYCQPRAYNPKYKRVMDNDYKLLNYLIQGSAADCTKQALINYYNHPKREGRMVLTVHDEIDFSAPAKRMKEEHKVLEECMKDVSFDVPMLSDGENGPNWGTLEKINAK